MALYYLRHLRSAAATGRRLSGGGISGISGGASETLACDGLLRRAPECLLRAPESLTCEPLSVVRAIEALEGSVSRKDALLRHSLISELFHWHGKKYFQRSPSREVPTRRIRLGQTSANQNKPEFALVRTTTSGSCRRARGTESGDVYERWRRGKKTWWIIYASHPGRPTSTCPSAADPHPGPARPLLPSAPFARAAGDAAKADPHPSRYASKCPCVPS